MNLQEAQSALSRLGYTPGPADGVFGARTRAALVLLQRDAGLIASGELDTRTRSLLDRLSGRVQKAAGLPAGLGHLSRFRLTHYVIAEQAASDRPANVPVLGRAGEELARVSARFFCDLALQGSGRLRDGRLLNVTGGYVSVQGHPAYAEVLVRARQVLPSKLAYAGIRLRGEQVTEALSFSVIPRDRAGKGWTIQRGIPCEPFRTLAADLGAYRTSDPRFRDKGGLVPSGTRVFVAELAGVRLPDRSTHDGWCVVNDTGGAIFGAHFDVFAGTRTLAKQVPLPAVGHVWFEESEERCPRDYTYGL